MIYILLPAFNEEENLPGLISGISMQFERDEHKIVIVNDGSTDNTQRVIESNTGGYPLLVINHLKNRGLGETLRTGFEHILLIAKNDDIIIAMDADNSHPPSLCGKMIQALGSGCDVVTASRFCEGGREIGVKAYRKLLSRTINLILSIMYPYKNVRDYTSGFRAYRAGFLGVFKDADTPLVTEKGFTATVEILLKCIKAGARVQEVPLVLRYDMKKGASKIKVLPTIARYFVLLLKMKYYRIKK
jgi:dolichol-phosphate mannosyltransferase